MPKAIYWHEDKEGNSQTWVQFGAGVQLVLRMAGQPHKVLISQGLVKELRDFLSEHLAELEAQDAKAQPVAADLPKVEEQPEPEVGDVWEVTKTWGVWGPGLRITLFAQSTFLTDGIMRADLVAHARLVERDGKPVGR